MTFLVNISVPYGAFKYFRHNECLHHLGFDDAKDEMVRLEELETAKKEVEKVSGGKNYKSENVQGNLIKNKDDDLGGNGQQGLFL